MRKLVIFLYFVFLFKLAFAQSLPSIPGLSSFKDVEPSAGSAQAATEQPVTEKPAAAAMPVQMAEASQVPSLENETDDTIPADFDLPVSDNAAKKDDKTVTATEKSGTKIDNNAPSIALPSTLSGDEPGKSMVAPPVPPVTPDASSNTGSRSIPDMPEVSDLPKIPDQNAKANAAATAPATAPDATPAPVKDAVAKDTTKAPQDQDDADIQKALTDDSVRGQFPSTPGLDYKNDKNDKKTDTAKTPEPTAADREKEVDNLLDQVFDKERSPEEVAKDKAEKENDEKMAAKEKDAKQDDKPQMENVVDLSDAPVAPIDDLKTDDNEQADLADLPDSMKDGKKVKGKKGKGRNDLVDNSNSSGTAAKANPLAYSSNTYSEQQLSDLLVKAAMNGDTQNVIELVHSGRNINAQNMYGESALMGAVYNGHNDVAEILLSEGADANVSDSKGNTSLIVASAKNNMQAVQLLLKSGANIDQANNSSDTALLVAALNNNAGVVDTLIRAGANINKTNADGLTVLHIAAYNGNVALTKYLLGVGANPNVVARGGFKPYDLAKNKSPEVAQILQAYNGTNNNTIKANMIATEIKQKNIAPVAAPKAGSDELAVYPKAYVQQEEEVEPIKSDWWAAKAPESANKSASKPQAGMSKPSAAPSAEEESFTEDARQDSMQTTSPVQNVEIISPRSAANNQSTPANGLKKVDYSGYANDSKPQPASLKHGAVADTTPVVAAGSVPANTKPVEAEPTQDKKWTKLTVDQKTMQNEEQKTENLKAIEKAKAQSAQSALKTVTPRSQATADQPVFEEIPPVSTAAKTPENTAINAPATAPALQKAVYEQPAATAPAIPASQKAELAGKRELPWVKPAPATTAPVTAKAPAQTPVVPAGQLVRAHYDNNGKIITTTPVAMTPAPEKAKETPAAPVVETPGAGSSAMPVGTTPIAASQAPAQPVQNINVAGFKPVAPQPAAIQQSTANPAAPASMSMEKPFVRANYTQQPVPQAVQEQLTPKSEQPALVRAPRLPAETVPTPAGTPTVSVPATQAQTAFYNQPISSNINVNIPRYADLDASKQAVWDKKLEEWVRSGINLKDDSQRIYWMKQQAILERVYQEQFQPKVDSIKKKIGAAAANVTPAVKKVGDITITSRPVKVSYEAIKTPGVSQDTFKTSFLENSEEAGDSAISN